MRAIEKRPGRPCKLTPEVRARLVRLIAAGVPACHACAAARVSFGSFTNWRKNDPIFAAELEEATGLAIEKHLAKIEAASDAGDWRASCWKLEHLFPAAFARNRIEVSGPDGSPLAAAIAIYLPAKDGTTPPIEVSTISAKEISDEG